MNFFVFRIRFGFFFVFAINRFLLFFVSVSFQFPLFSVFVLVVVNEFVIFSVVAPIFIFVFVNENHTDEHFRVLAYRRQPRLC